MTTFWRWVLRLAAVTWLIFLGLTVHGCVQEHSAAKPRPASRVMT